MPGARILTIVVTKLTPPIIDEMPSSATLTSQISWPLIKSPDGFWMLTAGRSPAGLGGAAGQQEARHQQDACGGNYPEGDGIEEGKRHVPRPDHQRYQVVG